jgi:hypothetical protein
MALASESVEVEQTFPIDDASDYLIHVCVGWGVDYGISRY